MLTWKPIRSKYLLSRMIMCNSKAKFTPYEGGGIPEFLESAGTTAPAACCWTDAFAFPGMALSDVFSISPLLAASEQRIGCLSFSVATAPTRCSHSTYKWVLYASTARAKTRYRCFTCSPKVLASSPSWAYSIIKSKKHNFIMVCWHVTHVACSTWDRHNMLQGCCTEQQAWSTSIVTVMWSMWCPKCFKRTFWR